MTELPLEGDAAFPPPANPRWAAAVAVCRGVLRRYPEDVHAIGVHGSLAHGDDHDGSDVDLVVVVNGLGRGPRPTAARIGGLIVDLGVISAEAYLAEARILTAKWPLAADQYLTTRALHDPHGWHERLRRTHLECLAATTDREFARLAGEALPGVASLIDKAAYSEGKGEPDRAAFACREAAAGLAVVLGLLTRTHFRGAWDAVARTGLAGAELPVLRGRLAEVVEQLDQHGVPVDRTVDQLLQT